MDFQIALLLAQDGVVNGAVYALLALALVLAALAIVVEAWRARRGLAVDWRSTLVWAVAFPALAALLALVVKPTAQWAQALTTLVLITPLGPLLYLIAFRPLADATVLSLLIVAVAMHGVLVGL